MSERDSARTSWLAALGLLAVTSVVGCDAPLFKGKSGADEGPVGRRSEAVVVDYYKAKTKVRSCAGTLLSSNVVVAPAHCADGTTKAVVNVLDSKKTRTSVSRVYTYDWVSADPSMVRSERHDVALLVLRAPVAKARFARIQGTSCAGCTVVQIGRTRDASGRVLGISKRLHLAKTVSNGTAYRMPLAASKVTKRGGAVYRVTKKDERVIVGLVVGQTKKSGQGVVVPLTNPVMQRWIRAVVKTEGNLALETRSAKTASALSTKNLRFLDEEEPTANNEEPAANNEEPAANNEEPQQEQEQVEDERPQEEQASDPAPQEDTESQNQGSEPVVEQPSSGEQPAAQENNETENPGAQNAAPEEPRNDPSDPVVPTGENQTEPQSSPDRDAQPAPASSEPGAYEDAQAAANREPAANGEDTPAQNGAENPESGGPSASNVRAGNDTNPPYPGTIAGVGALRAPARDEETTNHPGGNSVTVASPGDPAFKDDPALAQRYQGVANVYNSHGMPGTLVGGVPTDTVQRFMQDDKPLIVASCFSGAPMAGGSTIRRMASTYGGDPERVYGCSGYASGDTSGLGCTGTWVNGNGRAVPQGERQRLGLSQYQCSTNTFDANNQPVWSDCASND